LSQLGWSSDQIADLRRRLRSSLPSENGTPNTRSVEWNAIYPYFNAAYYLLRYSSLSEIRPDPVQHYLEKGWQKRYDPAKWLSTRDDLQHYADVRSSGLNPFYHFILTGQKEQRRSHLRGDKWEVVSSELDIGFYLSKYPDVTAVGIEPVQHYIDIGWRQYRDPTPWFSILYYLDHNSDIREAGLNPFLHYIRSSRIEHRQPAPYAQRTRLRDKKPRVSVIVPSYNHAKFLPERLDSILQQSYGNGEILVLDDASQDHSKEIIDSY
jgi:hypothetical protein